MSSRDYPYALGDRVVSTFSGKHGTVVAIHADLCRVEFDGEEGNFPPYVTYAELKREPNDPNS